MKRILSLLLSILLLLFLLSCGTTSTDEPNTPATPETSEPTVPTEVLVPFESTYMGIGVLGIEPQTQGDGDSYEKVIVVRSTDAFSAYAEKLDEVIAMCYTDVCGSEAMFKGMLNTIGMLSDMQQAVKRYNTEAFFEENLLLLLQTRTNSRKIRTNEVFVKETDGKKQLYIQNLIPDDGFASDGTPGITTLLLAIPNDLGVDLENDVIVSWEKVQDTLYLK